MKRTLRRVLMLLMLAVFIFSAGMVIAVKQQYKVSEKRYADAAARFTSPANTGIASDSGAASVLPGAAEDGTEAASVAETAPIRVDFEALRAVNPDVIGWIYCPDTVINYPIVHGGDNSFYLNRSYNLTFDPSGSIFSDARNAAGFTDPCVILYGHHMQNMTMFATIKYWFEQDYYDAHPVMWLLTPERDYRIDLLCGFVTSATSDSFSIYHDHGPDFDAYIRNAMARSEFFSGLEPDLNGNFVMLSTCAYVFDNARSVMYGQLVGVESAGGVPFAAADE